MLPDDVLPSAPPLPVEFVAGGEGSPDEEFGLEGGSGRSGSWLFGTLPMNIADNGRLELLEVRDGREDIGTSGRADVHGWPRR
jgi:hypothetical protein